MCMCLVHMDLCRLPEPSVGGCIYVATFLDDYSKFSVVRLLTRKADVPAMVKKVLTMMQTQCGDRCRVVTTENLE
jgi:hypothetical protein